MKRERVFERLRRWVFSVSGVLAAGTLMVAVVPLPMHAAEVVITVRGAIAPDSHDELGVFGVGPDLKGQPFTLTITFDASKGEIITKSAGCIASSVKGSTADGNPARAVLKIGTGSYVFGTKPESKWDGYKDTAPNCSGRGLGFHVMEGAMPQTSNFWVTLQGAPGKELRSGPSWQSPISTSRVYGIPTLGTFRITRPGDSNHAASGRLVPESLAISCANANSQAGNGSVAAAAELGDVGEATGEGHREQAGGNIVITVKGKVSIGHDDYGIFKVGRNLAGQNFTVVFVFSEGAKRQPHLCGDQSDGTSYLGTAKDVPAKTLLTIGRGSFVFGAQPDSEWGAFRGVASYCMEEKIAFNVKEGIYPQTTLLWVKLQPPEGGQPLNTSIDWSSPVSSSNLDKNPSLSSFGISRPNDYEHSDQGVLIPESVTVGRGNAGESQPSPENSGASLNMPSDSQSSSADGSPSASSGSSNSQGDTKPQPSLKERLQKAGGVWLHKLPITAP